MAKPSTPVTSVMPDMTNQTIDEGRLRLVRSLGEGAHGIVYLATDISAPSSSSDPSPRQYAVKVLIKAEEDTRESCYQQREITVQKFLSRHPRIVTLHKVIEDDWFIYLVLDYCPGGSLFEHITDYRTYCRNDELLRDVFLQIIDAVAACHERGIAHRDLKPDNIMCNENGTEVYLGDFGLATTSGISHSHGCGSSFYISPECLGADYNMRPYRTQPSDVWALGVILVNMIAGRSPWNRATSDDSCFLRYMGDPEYLQGMLPLTRGVSDILKRIFTWDASNRISLEELRMEIKMVSRFYLTEAEAAKGGKNLRNAYAHYGPMSAPRIHTPSERINDDELASSKSGSFSQRVPTAPSFDHFVIASATDLASLSNSASTRESEVPVTPGNGPVKDALLAGVLEMPEDQCMGNVLEKKIEEREGGLTVDTIMQKLGHMVV